MNKENTYSDGIKILKKIQENGIIIFGASGEMGSKITSTFAKANVSVIMQDIDKNKLIESKNEALKTLEKAAARRKLSKKQLEYIIEKKLIDKIIVFPERGKTIILSISFFSIIYSSCFFDNFLLAAAFSRVFNASFFDSINLFLSISCIITDTFALAKVLVIFEPISPEAPKIIMPFSWIFFRILIPSE